MAQAKFLEDAARAMDDSAFAPHLAEKANPREGGLLFCVAAAETGFGDALALLARYGRIVNEAARAKLARTSEGTVVDIDFVRLPRHEARQATEFSVAIVIRGLREAAGRVIRPTGVSLVHGRNSDLMEFERFFGCAVEFAAERDQLAFSCETLAVPLVTEDRYLLEDPSTHLRRGGERAQYGRRHSARSGLRTRCKSCSRTAGRTSRASRRSWR